jgi:hypothetical protein
LYFYAVNTNILTFITVSRNTLYRIFINNQA